MARPSIVPIALTVDDRTGYTLWAPPWEEDGEEWQAFLGTTEGDPDTGARAKVHLFPTPAALAAFCRTSTDHDLADHPVWPVVVTLGADDLTPDDDHRYDLDGVYDIASENPDRWAVEELAATVDIVSRLAECLDTTAAEDDEDDDADDDADVDVDTDTDTETDDAEAPEGQFEAVAELVAKPEIGSLGLGVEAFVGRAGEDAWVGVGSALDDLWEDVLEELSDHLDWTGAGTATLDDYPSAAEDDDTEVDDLADVDEVVAPEEVEPAAGAAAAAGVSTIHGARRVHATPEAVAAAAEFWETVGILPVEIVVPEGAGLTLRCYVEDRARFLGKGGEIYLFDSPTDLARFLSGNEEHDLTEIASWPEVADTDTLPLPADEDRYDLTELSEVLGEVADGGAALVPHAALSQPVEGIRDVAEYAGLSRVEALLSPSTPLGRAVAQADRTPDAPVRAEDAAELKREWDEVVTAVGTALIFRG